MNEALIGAAIAVVFVCGFTWGWLAAWRQAEDTRWRRWWCEGDE